MVSTKLIINFEKMPQELINSILSWKKEVLNLYGIGGYKKRTIELILEDLKKLRNKK